MMKWQKQEDTFKQEAIKQQFKLKETERRLDLKGKESKKYRESRVRLYDCWFWSPLGLSRNERHPDRR